MGNRFLDALPRDVAVTLGRSANLRVYAEGSRLNAPGDLVREVCFPIAGAIVHVERFDDGHESEVFTIGAEGISNFEPLLGGSHALYGRVTQVPVSAFVIDAGQLEGLRRRHQEIDRLINRYALAMIRVAGLTAGCARHDQVDARLAAWLLRLRDYAGSDQFAVTHERTSELLGARRATVTAAYNELAREGGIRLSRKHVEIVDPAILRRLACGCRRQAEATVESVYAPEANGAERCSL